MEFALGLLLAPLLIGVIRRVKAFFAGRRGPPLVQAYRDLWKLAHKSAVYSRTTTWVFRASAPLVLACTAAALLLANIPGFGFAGDFVLLVGLLAAARLALVLAALDTGSAFTGMGASREVAFAALAEPALLLVFASLARTTGETSLAGIAAGLTPRAWLDSGGLLLLVSCSLFGVLLVENARIPFDDPTTHLELTMIHEAMVLEHGGPDLAMLELASAWKLWLLAGVLARAVLPLHTGSAALDALAQAGGIAAVGIGVGVVESTMARLRLPRIPQMLVALALLALLSVVLSPARSAS